MSRAEPAKRAARAVAVTIAITAVACQIVVGIDAREVPRSDGGTDVDAEPTPPEPPRETGPVVDALAPCRVGEDRCGGACVDTRKDPTHCGSCARSCLGAECLNGECKPELWVPGVIAGSAWVSGDELLYRDGSDDSPTGVMAPLFAKNTKTGAVRYIADVGRYLSMAPVGGPTWVLLEHVPNARLRQLDIEIKGSFPIYTQPTADPAFRGGVVLGDDVYWTTRADVRHVRRDGTGYAVVYTPDDGGAAGIGIASSPTHLYFGVDRAGLWELERASGSARPLEADARVGRGSQFVTVLDGHVLWLTKSELRELPLPPVGAPTTVALDTNDGHTAIERDGYVWSVEVAFIPDGDLRSGRLQRYHRATKQRVVLATNLFETGQIAVDDRYVYLPTFGEGIYRVAR